MEMSDTDVIDAKAEPATTLRGGVAFLKLRAGQCRYPLGARDEPATRFCGDPALEGSPYCPDCRRIAYQRSDQRAHRLASWVARRG